MRRRPVKRFSLINEGYKKKIVADIGEALIFMRREYTDEVYKQGSMATYTFLLRDKVIAEAILNEGGTWTLRYLKKGKQ